ncbi:unnamed protein product [Pleuronectes platessa]|uniref:Ig-like domain-containing protein n=1 Tax=Pleuronectes platessa TaxID=8262 RepID=A0A9N7TYF7_PLEPL|nr:unnamed protein product [Pleuronectes platessa]
MTESSRGLFYLPIIYLWTGGVKGDILASLAPPVHLLGERLGWTLLVCMVRDFRRGHLEVSWRSPSDDYMSTAPRSIALSKKHRRHSPVSIITVVTSDWPSYRCSVSRRRHPRVFERHHVISAGHRDKTCNEDEKTEDIDVWTNTVVVLWMRLLLMKSIGFNALMTFYAVIKWKKIVYSSNLQKRGEGDCEEEEEEEEEEEGRRRREGGGGGGG